MKRLFSYALSPRGLVVLAIIAASCYATMRFSAHHESKSVFETLYLHLVPAALVGADHQPLFEFQLPSFLAFMDWGAGHASEAGEHASAHTGLFNLQIFQVAAVLLCFVCFAGVPSYLRTGKGDGLSRLFAGFAMWVRDEMVYPEMGKERGRRFLPFFLSIFFFILFMNVMGLVPGSVTPTASIFVTGALALVTFGAMLVCGMAAQGPVKFWTSLVPHVPLPLWPLMFLVELIGLVVKPFALMIRLFANMSGGHMVVLSFMGLIFFMARAEMWGDAGGWGTTPIGVGFAVFIMIIESFVALLQAFIFTQLSIMFVSASVHPEH